MKDLKKIAIVGSSLAVGDKALHEAVIHQLGDSSIHVITTDDFEKIKSEYPELNIDQPRPEPMELTIKAPPELDYQFNPPITRRQRRASERNKKKLGY